MGVIAKSGACVISIVTQISFGAVTAWNIYWQKGLNIKYLGGPFQVTWSAMGCCTTPEKKKKAVTHFNLGLCACCESVLWFLQGNHHQLVPPKWPHKGLQCHTIWQQNLFLPAMRKWFNHKAVRRTHNKNNGGKVSQRYHIWQNCDTWPCHHLLAPTDQQKVALVTFTVFSSSMLSLL